MKYKINSIDSLDFLSDYWLNLVKIELKSQEGIQHFFKLTHRRCKLSTFAFIKNIDINKTCEVGLEEVKVLIFILKRCW